ncbi:MAG: diacylglycerol kinase family protein [Raoultibacter sp.]
MKLLIINNLNSGLGEGSIHDFMRAFTRDGDELCLRSTDGTTALSSLLEDARDFDAVIVSGGDGTVASVCYLLRDSGEPFCPSPPAPQTFWP